MADSLIQPDWPAPFNVKALFSTRLGGVSPSPYDSLNLGDHVGDRLENVTVNRQILTNTAELPDKPLWLRQTHSTTVVDSQRWQAGIEADAIFSTQPNHICVVMTADCLPVLLCDKQGRQVAAIHAGWRGLCGGIIEQTVARLNAAPEDLLAWLGPAIGPAQFEVGAEVRDAFMAESAAAVNAFLPAKPGHYLADIYTLARLRLQRCDIRNVYGGGYCTVSQPELFFSYRRDGVTGRMTSLIWLAP
ncbi:MAG: peptidoglycan editing factor PgeF [Methylophaga sp.]|nr:peptidoglycan editing factor PgeF [Methylophaga sp.]